MPADQAGTTYKTTQGYGIRFARDGKRVRQTGFPSKSAARKWLQNVELPRQRGETIVEQVTLADFTDRFLTRYAAIRSPKSVRTIQDRMRRPLAAFGPTPLSDLRTAEIAMFEAELPPRFRHAVMRTLRQVLNAAVQWGYLTANPAKTGANPEPPPVERRALEVDEVEEIIEWIASPYDVAVVVGSWCYLRPSELLALERRDVGDGELRIRGTKTVRSVRVVPLPDRARDALATLPARIDSRLLFPAPAGGTYNLQNWRHRHFDPAVKQAGLTDVTPYSLRHSGISWALSVGVPPGDVSRFAGTSIRMIERVYHHLIASSVDTARGRMNLLQAEGSGQVLPGG